jgi:hypothetical protein
MLPYPPVRWTMPHSISRGRAELQSGFGPVSALLIALLLALWIVERLLPEGQMAPWRTWPN